MKKRLKKKQAYKDYIQAIFKGYERMLENPEVNELTFSYMKEETRLTRDNKQQIRFLTHDVD